MTSLHPSQFGPLFHGTRANLGVGDTVLPANKSNAEMGPGTWGDPDENSSGNYAFAMHGSGDHEYSNADAENYAWQVTKLNATSGARPRVLEVSPAKDMEPGDYHHDSAYSNHNRAEEMKDYDLTAEESDAGQVFMPEYRSKTGMKVTKVHDIMPGRQGTFPQENWAKYHLGTTLSATPDDPHPDRSFSVNHPQDPSGIPRYQAIHNDHMAVESEGSHTVPETKMFHTPEEASAHMATLDEHMRARHDHQALFPVTKELRKGSGTRYSDFHVSSTF